MKATDTSKFIQDLNAGVFADQLGRALSDVAAGCIDHGKEGQVIITLKLKQIAQTNQVNITHKLDYVQPTKRGKKREDTTLDTRCTSPRLACSCSRPTRPISSSARKTPPSTHAADHPEPATPHHLTILL